MSEHQHYYKKHVTPFGSVVAYCSCGATKAGLLQQSDFGLEVKP
jgi:hypothetical protein